MFQVHFDRRDAQFSVIGHAPLGIGSISTIAMADLIVSESVIHPSWDNHVGMILETSTPTCDHMWLEVWQDEVEEADWAMSQLQAHCDNVAYGD